MAAKALEKALTSEIDPNLTRLKAVVEQRARLEKYRVKFSKRVRNDLMNHINFIGNETGNLESGMGNSTGTTFTLSRFAFRSCCSNWVKIPRD